MRNEVFDFFSAKEEEEESKKERDERADSWFAIVKGVDPLLDEEEERRRPVAFRTRS